MATYSGGPDQDKLEDYAAKIAKAREDVANINKKLKNKKLSKAKRASLNASKKKINALIKQMALSAALEAKKPRIQNITSLEVGAKPSKIKLPVDNPFAVSETGVAPDTMEKVFFDSIGATEIINIARHDNINTVNPPYLPIVDAASVNLEYDPNKIVSLQKTSSAYFNSFGIDLDQFIPTVGTGESGEVVYVESETGDLIINVLDLPANFSVEVETMSFDQVFNDTIYT